MGMMNKDGIGNDIKRKRRFWDGVLDQNFITVKGNTAKFKTSRDANIGAWKGRKVKISIELINRDGSRELYDILVARIQNVETSKMSEYANLKLESIVSPLLGSSAERVKDGFGWYQNRPISNVIHNLLWEVYKDEEGNLPLSKQINTSSLYITSPDGSHIVWDKGLPPGWDGEVFDPDPILNPITAMTKGYKHRGDRTEVVFMALADNNPEPNQSELWMFEPQRNLWTQLSSYGPGGEKKRIKKLLYNEEDYTIYGYADAAEKYQNSGLGHSAEFESLFPTIDIIYWKPQNSSGYLDDDINHTSLPLFYSGQQVIREGMDSKSKKYDMFTSSRFIGDGDRGSTGNYGGGTDDGSLHSGRFTQLGGWQAERQGCFHGFFKSGFTTNSSFMKEASNHDTANLLKRQGGENPALISMGKQIILAGIKPADRTWLLSGTDNAYTPTNPSIENAILGQYMAEPKNHKAFLNLLGECPEQYSGKKEGYSQVHGLYGQVPRYTSGLEPDQQLFHFPLSLTESTDTVFPGRLSIDTDDKPHWFSCSPWLADINTTYWDLWDPTLPHGSGVYTEHHQVESERNRYKAAGIGWLSTEIQTYDNCDLDNIDWQWVIDQGEGFGDVASTCSQHLINQENRIIEFMTTMIYSNNQQGNFDLIQGGDSGKGIILLTTLDSTYGGYIEPTWADTASLGNGGTYGPWSQNSYKLGYTVFNCKDKQLYEVPTMNEAGGNFTTTLHNDAGGALATRQPTAAVAGKGVDSAKLYLATTTFDSYTTAYGTIDYKFWSCNSNSHYLVNRTEFSDSPLPESLTASIWFKLAPNYFTVAPKIATLMQSGIGTSGDNYDNTAALNPAMQFRMGIVMDTASSGTAYIFAGHSSKHASADSLPINLVWTSETIETGTIYHLVVKRYGNDRTYECWLNGVKQSNTNTYQFFGYEYDTVNPLGFTGTNSYYSSHDALDISDEDIYLTLTIGMSQSETFTSSEGLNPPSSTLASKENFHGYLWLPTLWKEELSTDIERNELTLFNEGFGSMTSLNQYFVLFASRFSDHAKYSNSPSAQIKYSNGSDEFGNPIYSFGPSAPTLNTGIGGYTGMERGNDIRHSIYRIIAKTEIHEIDFTNSYTQPIITTVYSSSTGGSYHGSKDISVFGSMSPNITSDFTGDASNYTRTIQWLNYNANMNKKLQGWSFRRDSVLVYDTLYSIGTESGSYSPCNEVFVYDPDTDGNKLTIVDVDNQDGQITDATAFAPFINTSLIDNKERVYYFRQASFNDGGGSGDYFRASPLTLCYIENDTVNGIDIGGYFYDSGNRITTQKLSNAERYIAGQAAVTLTVPSEEGGEREAIFWGVDNWYRRDHILNKYITGAENVSAIKSGSEKHFYKFDNRDYDPIITLADFSNLKIWEAINRLASAFNFLFGFDLEEVFLVKPTVFSKEDIIEFRDTDGEIKDMKVKIDDTIRNVITVIPYQKTYEDSKWEIVLSTDASAEGAFEGSLIISQSHWRDSETIYKCVREGILEGEVDKVPWFKFLTHSATSTHYLMKPILKMDPLTQQILYLNTLYKESGSIFIPGDAIIIKDPETSAIHTGIIDSINLEQTTITLRDLSEGEGEVDYGVNINAGIGTEVQITNKFTANLSPEQVYQKTLYSERAQFSNQGVAFITTDPEIDPTNTQITLTLNNVVPIQPAQDIGDTLYNPCAVAITSNSSWAYIEEILDDTNTPNISSLPHNDWAYIWDVDFDTRQVVICSHQGGPDHVDTADMVALVEQFHKGDLLKTWVRFPRMSGTTVNLVSPFYQIGWLNTAGTRVSVNDRFSMVTKGPRLTQNSKATWTTADATSMDLYGNKPYKVPANRFTNLFWVPLVAEEFLQEYAFPKYELDLTTIFKPRISFIDRNKRNMKKVSIYDALMFESLPGYNVEGFIKSWSINMKTLQLKIRMRSKERY